MINDKTTELIERYLNGELEGHLLAEFNDRLADDNFRREVEIQRAIVANSKKVGRTDLKQHLKKIHLESILEKKNDDSSNLSVSKKTRNTRVLKQFLGIAASIIILCTVLGVYFFNLSPHQLYVSKFRPYPLTITRGNATNEYCDKYESKDYDGYIRNYELDSQKSIQEIFLAGNAYLAIEETEKAIQCFHEVIQINESVSIEAQRYFEESEYYLALSYLSNNQISQAETIFENIANDKDHSFNDKVTSLFLWKIKLLKLRTN